ncbi:asparaginase [Planosporangium thailandense]|uniref:asparaginase n=1 Tax=Planosporangium thailandense TaxID=765197 RepID=UPI0030B855BA
MATGGTIASRAGAGGRVASARGQDLLAQTTVPRGITVTVHDVPARGSFAWSLADLRAIVHRIRAALDDEVSGVVVTHGTDTMEETVFLASLLIDDDRPVVFTGAQRPFDDPAPDGPANLADALAVATSDHARGRGPLLCFDGHAFAARGVRKVETLGSHAFDAPGRGPVLRVANGSVLPLTAPGRPPVLPADPGELARVDVISMYVGADAALLRAAAAAGARGIVLAAFGVGNANDEVVDAVRTLTETGVPVLVCSRVPSGPVSPLYGGGGGVDLARAGAVFASDLSPWQARLLLSAALAVAPEDPVRVVSAHLPD